MRFRSRSRFRLATLIAAAGLIPLGLGAPLRRASGRRRPRGSGDSHAAERGFACLCREGLRAFVTDLNSSCSFRFTKPMCPGPFAVMERGGQAISKMCGTGRRRKVNE
jgi:hypothetical protein